MAFGKKMKFGVGVTAAALVSMASIGFVPKQQQLPTVTVHQSPT